MAKIISGKELSAKLKLEMADEVKTFPAKYGRVPHLVVILVGEDPGSVSYVTGKAKASAEVGIRNTTIRKPESVSEAELLDIITALNLDDEVDGILVQLPLPKHIDEDKVIAAIDKQKDVDRLPSPERCGAVAETALHAPLHPERHSQDAAGRRRGDRRQARRGDRPQQYRGASRV